MIDGTYNVEIINSPLGNKRGTVVLRVEGDKLIADIDAPIIKKQHIEGHAEGDSFTAEGTFKLLLVGKVSYSLRGEVSDDELRATIDSSKGAFELAGVRV